jgi:hypothetical protein
MQRFDASTMTLTDPPHRLQTSIYPRAPSLDAAHQFTLSMLNTRFSGASHDAETKSLPYGVRRVI